MQRGGGEWVNSLSNLLVIIFITAIYYLGMLSLGGSQAVWSADPVNIENLMKDGIESNRPQPIAVKQSIASSNAGIETNVPSPSAEKQNSSSGNNFFMHLHIRQNTHTRVFKQTCLIKYIYQMRENQPLGVSTNVCSVTEIAKL